MAAHRMTASPARPTVAYLLAPSHSGSTLLALLLASHPQVATVGELNLSAVDDRQRYLCSCGTRLKDCDFWRQIASRMAARNVEFDVLHPGTDFRHVNSGYVARLLRPLHRGRWLEAGRDSALALSSAWRATYRRVQTRNAALVQAVADETGARVIVDSSKIGIRLKFLLRNPDIDVRVVRVVRDGRAVALTYTDPARYADASNPALRGGGTGGTREHEKLRMDAAAREWLRSHEEADALLAGLDPSRWMQVRYEAVCTETEDTLAQVFRFLGVDPAAPRVPFRQAGHHVVGNGMRLDTSSDIAVDERWRSLLTAVDQQVFDAVAGQRNRRFGYST